MGISSPLKGGILLDMVGIDKIPEVNRQWQYVIAEGGASVYAIHYALRQHGLMLPNLGTYGPAVVIGAMIDVPEIEEKAMGAKAQEHGLHGWPDYHVMGPDGWCGAVVRHSGMFAVISKMYPLTFLKEMYDLDEAAKRECGIWDAEHCRSTIAMSRAIWQSEEYFVSKIHTTMKMQQAAKVDGFGAGVQQSTWGGLDRADAEHKGPLPYERLTNLYDLVKEIKHRWILITS